MQDRCSQSKSFRPTQRLQCRDCEAPQDLQPKAAAILPRCPYNIVLVSTGASTYYHLLLSGWLIDPLIAKFFVSKITLLGVEHALLLGDGGFVTSSPFVQCIELALLQETKRLRGASFVASLRSPPFPIPPFPLTPDPRPRLLALASKLPDGGSHGDLPV